MTEITPIRENPVATQPSPTGNDADRIAGAAEQFEALLVEQMLRAMRDGGAGGWMGTGEDKSGESLMEYAEQEISRVIAKNGGFGLAKMVSAGLTPRSDGTQPEPRTAPSR